MARTGSSHGFTAVRTEGAILPPSFLLDSVSTLKAKNQSGPDYGLSKSLSLRDEIARYWSIARDQFEEYEERKVRIAKSGRSMADRDWPIPLIRSVLGYEDLERTEPVHAEDRYFPLTHRACERTVPMLLTFPQWDLDKADACFGCEGRRQAPHSLMQEFLNAEDSCLWGVVSNGSGLRLLRDNVNLTRPAFIEADLEAMFREELYSDFAAFWLTAHESRLRPPDGSPSGCILERWRQQAHKEGERALDRMREGVTEALLRFGNGFLQHPRNERLRGRLESGDLTPEAYYEQLLRLVYRLLFLFTTEERDLLHVPDASEDMRRIYSEGYSVSRLRHRALMGRHYDHHEDLWSSLRILFTSLQRGEPRIGLPGLGGLFASGHCPDLDGAAIANRDLLEAIRHLGYFRHQQVLTRINYRDMGTEELGSVYESLLDYHPVLDVESSPWEFKFAGEGMARKLTGSYYTPAVLVNELIRSALDPVLSQAVRGGSDDPRRAILSLNVIDPACGSGHFLLAAARRMASELARIRTDGSSPDERMRRRALREVVQHSIYGVDRNPLAVELCKTALWIEALEPGKPLTFLDPHIRHGDSLIGILDPAIMRDGIPDQAYKPLTGDDPGTCVQIRNQNRGTGRQGDLFDEDGLADIVAVQSELLGLSEETIDDIKRKASSWNASHEAPAREKQNLHANLFTCAFVTKKTDDIKSLVPIREDINSLNHNVEMRDGVAEHITRVARDYQFFHWHICFAEVMRSGGFDVVLSNPPWERIEMQEKEFFQNKAPEIANAPNQAARYKLINDLDSSESTPAQRRLYWEFCEAKRKAESLNLFMRSSGRYPLTSRGKINTYAVFSETFLYLLNPLGRAGFIVPTGIATDSSTQMYFREITTNLHLVSLMDFENREKLFNGVHSSFKFCLLTLGSNCRNPSYSFFAKNTHDLRRRNQTFELSREDIVLLKPNTRTTPIFRSRRDAEITKKIYRKMALIRNQSEPHDQIPWKFEFRQLFNMASDSGLFRTWKQLEQQGARRNGTDWIEEGAGVWSPLIEAKMFHQYDHRWKVYESDGNDARVVTAVEKRDPNFESIPRYWVRRDEITMRIGVKGKERKGKEADFNCTIRHQDTSWLSASSHGRPTAEPQSQRLSRLKDWATRGRLSGSEVRIGTQTDHACNEPQDGTRLCSTGLRSGPQGCSGLGQRCWLSFRKTARSTDERTSIMTLLPENGMSDRAPVIRLSDAESEALMVSVFNSFVFDYCTRNAIGGTDLSYFIIEQLPVPRPEDFMQRVDSSVTYRDFVIPRVLELTYTAWSLQPFAVEIGYNGPPFRWCDERRFLMKCEIDAAMFHLYGLNLDEVKHVMETFPIVKRHDDKQYSEFRTKRVICELFNDIRDTQVNGRQFQTRLSPPPGVASTETDR